LFVPSFGAFKGTEARLLFFYIIPDSLNSHSRAREERPGPKGHLDIIEILLMGLVSDSVFKDRAAGVDSSVDRVSSVRAAYTSCCPESVKFLFQSVFRGFSRQPRVAISSIRPGGVNAF